MPTEGRVSVSQKIQIRRLPFSLCFMMLGKNCTHAGAFEKLPSELTNSLEKIRSYIVT